MSKKIIVIGSNSFSGSAFCRHLLSQGIKVIGISRSVQPISQLLPHSGYENGNFEFFQFDVNYHLAEIERLIDKEKPKYIYNFAAQSMVGQSWESPEHWFMTNTVSMIKLHNILRKKDFLERYIHVSTPEVYGGSSGYQTEHNKYFPSSPYATSRAAADMSLHNFYDVYDFPVVFTRAANVYGAEQQLYRIIPRTILYALMGKKLSLHGGGHSERSFIEISDVSVATQLIGESGVNGDIYHIATKETVSIRSLVETICSLMNYEFNDLVEVTEDRKGKDQAYLLNSDKLRSELHWQDNVSLSQGIEQSIRWVKNNINILSKQPIEYIHKP